MAQPQPTLYEIEDYETGDRYQVEAYEDGTTYEEAVNWFSTLPDDQRKGYLVSPSPVAVPKDIEPSVEPTQVPPSPRTPAPLARQQATTEIVGLGEGGGDERFFDPEVESRLSALQNDPSVPYEQVVNAIKQESEKAGRKFLGYDRKAFEAYREGLEKGYSPQSIGYQDPLEALDLQAGPTSTIEDSGFISQVGRSMQSALQEGGAGMLARYLNDWADTGKEDLRSLYPSLTEEELEEMQSRLPGHIQRKVREANALELSDDDMVPWLIGQIFTPDPADIIPLGKAAKAATSAGRIGEKAATLAAFSGTADLGYQMSEIDDEVIDEFDPTRALLSAGTGAALGGTLQGVGEVGSAISRKIRGDGGGAEEVRQPISVPTAKKGSRQYKQEMAQTTDQITTKVNETAQDWTNPPEVTVHTNFTKVRGVDNNALGVYTKDGRVLINAEGLARAAQARDMTVDDLTTAVTFHEALGHHGLTQKFGDDLDDMLNTFYEDGSKEFRQRVDDWMARNPEAYQASGRNAAAQDPAWTRIRATEEVLAEWSEKEGQLPNSMFNQLIDYIKQLGREYLGLDLNYSSREIRGILATSQRVVVEGESTGSVPGVNKNMRGESTDPDSLTADELIESEQAWDTLKRISDNYTPERLSIENIEEEALLRGLKPSDVTRWVGKSPGDLTRRIFMYDIASQKLNTRLQDINEKIRTEGLTEARQLQYLKTATALEDVTSKAFAEQGELGRALSSIRKINYTRKRVGTLKEALAEYDLEALADPETFMKFMNEMEADRKAAEKADSKGNPVLSALNVPRAVMSSFDLSAPMRQGVVFVGTKNYWKSFVNMFRMLGPSGEANYQQLMRDIASHENYNLMGRARLSFSDINGKLSSREEDFQSDLAKEIPVIGTGVKQSEQAYAGFLNKLRADMFNQYVEKYRKAGVDVENEVELLESLGSFINSATGRAELPGGLRSAAPQLNAVFFSPRLIQSRINILGMNPKFYYDLDPRVRMEAISSMASFGSIALLSLGIMSELMGADVETDPRSSDFAKSKFGDTRYDVFGGFGQYLTFAARTAMWMGGYDSVKSASGETRKYGTKFGEERYAEAAIKFFRNKLSPNASFVADYGMEENAIGEPFTWAGSTTSRLIPMHMQSVIETAEKEGLAKGVLMTTPGLFGIGVNTYVPKSIDPDQVVEAPEDFTMEDLDDGENEQISVSEGVVTLKPETREMWGATINTYFQTFLREDVVATGLSWDELEPITKKELISEAKKDARSEAKKDMLYELGLD